MTREEKIELLEFVRQGLLINARVKSDYDIAEALGTAISALKGPTREQVEKVWRGEWEEERFAGELEGWQHRECGRHSTEKSMWCPKCGKAMTDKAVDMVMERMEALHSETKTD